MQKFWRSTSTLTTITIATLILCLIRLGGGLQYFELKIYDLYNRLVPKQESNERITIVSIDEENIQKSQQVSLDDLTLARVLQSISQHNPRVIALDLHRDIPIPPGTLELNETLANTAEIIGVALLGDPHIIPPHPILKEQNRYAGSGVILDSDSVVRRVFLFPLTETEPGTPSIGLAAAIAYLEEEGIIPSPGPSGDMQIGKTEYHGFQSNDGAYIRQKFSSYQIILPWRNPPSNFTTINVQDLLDGNYDPKDIEDKVIFIGSTAASLKDYFLTPFSTLVDQKNPEIVYGVHVHANLTAAILDNLFSGKPLIKIWSEPVEYLWIIVWTLVPFFGAFLVYRTRAVNKFLFLVLFIIAITSSIVLVGITYLAFLSGWWIPVLPPFIGVWVISIVATILLYIDSLRQANSNLEAKVEERTKKLQSTLDLLQSTQQQLIIKEKNNYLVLITAGLIHELKNPLFLTQNYLNFISDKIERMYDIFCEEISESAIEEYFENYNESRENLSLSKKHIQRAEDLINNLISGKNETKNSEISLNQLIKNNTNLVYKSYQDLPITLEIEEQLQDNLPLIECNSVKMTQVIINLVQNAIQSILEKAKTANSDYLGKIILFTKQVEQNQLQFSIFDNGIGINSEIKNRLFEPFFTTKPAGQGLGLGLSLSQIIIQEHHGSIDCQSNKNLTEFRVILPISQNLNGTT